jgi:hypothetical protein
VQRGARKPALNNRTVAPPRCAAMAVGSVPHTDPAVAVALVLETTPEIPAWPQLPRRSFRENMYAQFTEGLPGVVVDVDALRVFVRDELPADDVLRFLEALEGGDPGAFALSVEYASGLPLLGEALRKLDSDGSPPAFVKGQVTGPVSFALTIPREDRRALFYDETLRDISTKLITQKARWQEQILAGWSPESVPLIMVDEPCLTQMGSAVVNVPVEPAMACLHECLTGIDCLTGIHVCGGTDWERIAQLPVDVLNVDAADHLTSLVAYRDAVAMFVRDGGYIAWGAVPNDDRATHRSAEEVSAQVISGADALAAAGPGLSTDAVLAASFVSPACGTGSLSPTLAERCLRLAAETSVFLRERL